MSFVDTSASKTEYDFNSKHTKGWACRGIAGCAQAATSVTEREKMLFSHMPSWCNFIQCGWSDRQNASWGQLSPICMCHKPSSIWHTLQLRLWWTVKLWLFRWNCSCRRAQFKNCKLGSHETHTHTLKHTCIQVSVKAQAHILYTHTYTPLVPANISLRLTVSCWQPEVIIAVCLHRMPESKQTHRNSRGVFASQENMVLSISLTLAFHLLLLLLLLSCCL